MNKFDVVIVGGSASGLAAAVVCVKNIKQGKRICLIEKEDKLGRKLLATGNGKCNLSNADMSVEHFNCSSREFLSKHLNKFSVNILEKFLFSIGIVCKKDQSGRIYPNSAQASSVLKAFYSFLKYSNVVVMCSSRVKKIKRINDNYHIFLNDQIITSDKVIIASGGMAQPILGSSGDSYVFAKELNLPCTMLFPSLAPIICYEKYLNILKGVRFPSEVSLCADGNILKTEYGEIQFNSNNISGICVFQLARFVNEFFTLGSIEGKKINELSVHVDFLPEYSLDEIEVMLFKKKKNCGYQTMEDFLSGIINNKIGLYILRKNGIDTNLKLESISKENMKKIAESIKNTVFIPSGKSDYKNAQVTSGGISISQIDENMQSKKYNGLYIVGEALDVDGDCGGYNLHWAFTSGMAAGYHAANSIR